MVVIEQSFSVDLTEFKMISWSKDFTSKSHGCNTPSFTISVPDRGKFHHPQVLRICKWLTSVSESFLAPTLPPFLWSTKNSAKILMRKFYLLFVMKSLKELLPNLMPLNSLHNVNRYDIYSQPIIFNSGQKMALRVIYIINATGPVDKLLLIVLSTPIFGCFSAR